MSVGRELTEWEQLMRDAIEKSQRESYSLYKNGIVDNETFENSQEVIMDDDYDEGYVPLSLFTELNS